MAYARIGITNFDELQKRLEGKKANAEKVMKRLTADAQKRVPGWIAAGVTTVYGIKKAEITGGKVGSVKVKGNGFKDLKFIYAGRMLTPVHFNMKPKTAPIHGNSYTIRATILKGNREVIGNVKKLSKKQRKTLAKNFTRSGIKNSPESPYMLQHTGATDTSKVQYIPFQRRSQPGKRMHKFTTVSLPQMVSSERTREPIRKCMNKGLEKRMAHHMKLLDK